MTHPHHSGANLRGALWMITSMGIFAIEDTLIKAASQHMSITQILVFFGLGGMLLFATIALLNGENLFPRAAFSQPMHIRACFEITGRLFYFLAISLIPLSAATVILQATPLVVVAGAALVFGETVGWRRWAAIFIGLAGVLIIIQPGTDGFSALSILAIIGMLGFAGRDLASRAAPQSLSTNILGTYGFASVVVAGLLYSLWNPAPFVIPSREGSLTLLAAICAGLLAYSCLMKAMRTGEVSAVTPFRYTRLIFGIALGMLYFNESLTTPMILGSCLIVLSGIFIMWRGKQKAQD